MESSASFVGFLLYFMRCLRSRIRPTTGRLHDETALFSSVSPNTDTTSMLRSFHLRDEINSFVILSNLSLARTEFFLVFVRCSFQWKMVFRIEFRPHRSSIDWRKTSRAHETRRNEVCTVLLSEWTEALTRSGRGKKTFRWIIAEQNSKQQPLPPSQHRRHAMKNILV